MKKTYIILLSVIGLFILVTGVAFAYFYATNNNSDVGVSGSAKEINVVEYLPGSSMDIPVSGIYPGWIGVMDFTVGKPDGVTAGVGTYEIVLETDIDPAYGDWITYELYKSTDMGKSITRVEGTLSDDIFNLYVNDSLTPNGYTIPDDAFIDGVTNSTTGDVSVDKQSYDFSTYQNTKYYLVMRFLNADVNQNAAINKNFEIKVVMKEVVSDNDGDGYKDPVIAGGDPIISESESSSYKMLPVLITDNGTVTVADTSKEWYNYDNKEWANAVIADVTSLEITPGTVIPMGNIEQMYVWIPRYQYDPASIESAAHAIDVTFVDVTQSAHPAFTFGTDELAGLWVGKFELGWQEGFTDNESRPYNDGIDTTYIIKPNVNSVHHTNVSTMFYNIQRTSTTYSLDVTNDVHLIKNMEWGAVAYLSQSKYGVCNNDGTCSEKIENNNKTNLTTSDIVTGCGGDDTFQNSTLSGIEICPEENRWTTAKGVEASTTKNITGIYDLAGGRYEFVMGGIQDESGSFDLSNTGFTVAPDAKYYDSYAYGTSESDFTRGLPGDATIELDPGYSLSFYNSEMIKWNGDYARFVDDYNTWLLRGAQASGRTDAGVWTMYSFAGVAWNDISSRAVLSII